MRLLQHQKSLRGVDGQINARNEFELFFKHRVLIEIQSLTQRHSKPRNEGSRTACSADKAICTSASDCSCLLCYPQSPEHASCCQKKVCGRGLLLCSTTNTAEGSAESFLIGMSFLDVVVRFRAHTRSPKMQLHLIEVPAFKLVDAITQRKLSR